MSRTRRNTAIDALVRSAISALVLRLSLNVTWTVILGSARHSVIQCTRDSTVIAATARFCYHSTILPEPNVGSIQLSRHQHLQVDAHLMQACSFCHEEDTPSSKCNPLNDKDTSVRSCQLWCASEFKVCSWRGPKHAGIVGNTHSSKLSYLWSVPLRSDAHDAAAPEYCYHRKSIVHTVLVKLATSARRHHRHRRLRLLNHNPHYRQALLPHQRHPNQTHRRRVHALPRLHSP